MAFFPLCVRTGFSYLSSTVNVEKVASFVRKRGMEGCAIVDSNLAGYAPFAHVMEKAGLKAVFGYEASIGKDTKIVLLVRNEDGYKELLRLSYLASKRELNLDDLRLPHEGLVSIFPFVEGVELPEGIDYVGLPYGLNSLTRIKARNLYGDKLLALPRISYFDEKDKVGVRLLSSVERKIPLEEIPEGDDGRWPTLEEISDYYRPEEIALSERIAGFCGDFTLFKKRGRLLEYPCDGNPDEVLRKRAEEGLTKRKGTITDECRKRLDYELSIINRMGYSSYFLIVEDYVNKARELGISVGPGRGSAAGSLVSYALGIVEPDPLEHGLLFERFLNPERRSMPDIDVDFADSRRDELVAYLFSRYPGGKVARVLTSQTIGAKEAIRDAGRALGYLDREVSLLSSSIHNPMRSLADNYRESGDFKSLVDGDEYYLRLVSHASKIEGLPRQRGIHAAGVVLDESPLMEVAPCREEPGNGLVINLEKDYLEEQGFLKFDILGLRNLSILDLMLYLVEKMGGPHLEYGDLDINDKDALALIAQGKTMGLFQLESEGMRKAAREVVPSKFDDVAALLALYRPGPMQYISSYARRKKGRERVAYIAPELKPILDETYGIIVYQEQIMLLAEAYAGYSFGEADVLRRAISKKSHEALSKGRKQFVERSVQKGHPAKEAEQVYNLIERFANYGFNKSHAVSYAYLSMYMAYVKAHYPAAFYAGYLSFLSSSDPKFNLTLSEMRERGLSLCSPSINGPFAHYEPKDGKIAVPLSSIRGLPSPIVRGIAEERAKGEWVDIFDFARRMLPYSFKQEQLVALIDAGALDFFDETRSTFRATSYQAVQYGKLFVGESGMECLLELNIPKPALIKREKDLRVDIDAEEEMLGMIVSTSPFAPYEEGLRAMGAEPLSIGLYKEKAKVYALVDGIKAIVTKKGTRMAFLSVHDETVRCEGTVFSENYDRLYPILKEGNILVLDIERDRRNEGRFLLVDATLYEGE